MYISLNVDDMLVISSTMKRIVEVKKMLSLQFTMKDLREAKNILGMKIIKDRKKKEIMVVVERLCE